MKYLKRYNESIRDAMKPKSEEEILVALKGMSSDDKLTNLYRGSGRDENNLYKYFTEDEVSSMIQDLPDYRKGIFLRVAIAYRDYDFVKKLLDSGADPNLDDGWPLMYVTNWKEHKLAKLLRKYGAKPHVNESVRNSMKPKPESEIRKELEKLPARKLMHTAVMNGVDIRDIFSKEEIAGLNRRMKKEFQEDIKELRSKIVELNDSYYKGDMKESMDDDNKGYEIELNFPGCMRVWARKELDNVYFEAGYELEPMGKTTRVISDWEEPETLTSCVACIKSWLNVHWFKPTKELLNKYDDTNESIRDAMKPKSTEDIKKSLEVYQPDERYDMIRKNDFEKLYSGEEWGEFLKTLSPGKKIEAGCTFLYEWLIKEGIKEGATPQEMAEGLHIIEDKDRWYWKTISKIATMLINAGAYLDGIGGKMILDQAADQGDTKLLKLILDKRTLGPVGERIFRMMKTYRVTNGRMENITDGNPEVLNMLREYRRKVKQAKQAKATNESVRDMMKPRPKEDIRKKVNDLESETSIYTKFLSAAKYGLVDILEDMIGDERITKILKNDAMWMAAKRGETESVKFLLDNGADINTGGNMSLVNAVINNHYDTVKLLLDRGAVVGTHYGEPLNIAYRNGSNEIYDLLKKYMKER